DLKLAIVSLVKYGSPLIDKQAIRGGCALLRKKFKEDLFSYCIENGILQDSCESSNDNTNVVNALQEPFVCNQDHGKDSSQSPPHINHHCSYECGDPLEDIFCHQCTCELCGNGAHYGYNYPSKVLVIPDLELSTIKPPPLQPPTYSYEFCRNNAYYGHDCSLQVPFTYEEMSVEFLQEKRNQMDSAITFLRKFNQISFYKMPKVLSLAWEIIHEIELAFEDKHCQTEDILELFQRLHNDVQNIHEELAVYINTSNWDRPTICYDDDDDDHYAIAVTPSSLTEEPDNSLSMEDEHLDTIPAIESDEFIQSSVENLVPIPSESEGIPDNMCDVPFHDNSPPLDVSKDQFKDLSDYNDESTSTDDDSFSIDNIEYVEASPPNSNLVSSKVMKIVILEVGGIEDDILLTIKDDILCEKLLNINLLIANIEALNDNPTPSSDLMTKSSSTYLNSLLEETNTFDNYYEAFYDNHFKEINSGSITTHSDSFLYDSFIFDLLINPFPPADRSNFHEFSDELTHIISQTEYDCFCFKNEPNSGDFTMDVVEGTFPTREPRVHNALPAHPTL
nr:hypothetical protein [Tanacetum cinerariifolium]